MATATASARRPTRALGHAWLALCFALAIHVADEAASGFLSVWNPTVLAIRERVPWAPLPTFTFPVWMGGLVALVLVLAMFTPAFLRGGGRLRPLAWLVAVIMIGNGLGHIAATIFGRTMPAVQVVRPVPGFYSSMVLIAAAVIVLVELRATRPKPDSR